MSTSSVLTSIAIVAFAVSTAEGSDQAVRVPVAIRLTLKGAEARLGARVPVVVSLRNFKGEAVAATERLDIALESSLPAKVERVSIPSGKDSVTATVIFAQSVGGEVVAGIRGDFYHAPGGEQSVCGSIRTSPGLTTPAALEHELGTEDWLESARAKDYSAQSHVDHHRPRCGTERSR